MMVEVAAFRPSRIGLFRAGLTPGGRLEQATIGREELLAGLLDKLAQDAGKEMHQHHLILGPRGSGKTHLLSVLAHRIASAPSLVETFVVLRFAEETHRLLSFADFLLRICEVLSSHPGHDDWRSLYGQLAEEDKDQKIIDTLEPKLNQYRRDRGRLLLLFVENLDEILTRQIKGKQGTHQLRMFLRTTPSLILVATAPIACPTRTDDQRSLYEFFDIQTLDDFSQAQTVEVIRANLVYDQRKGLLDRFDRLFPKIKALHELTGGNPRLIMMHYALIVDEGVQDVRQHFEALLDRVSPFYQDRIQGLPPQERAVLETMALIRTEPKTPALIARRLRKSPQQTSSLLKRLIQSGHLEVMDHPRDRRSKIYRIKEGFFDIWLGMNDGSDRRTCLLALAEFFEWWYEREERQQRRRVRIDRLIAGDLSAQPKQDHSVHSGDLPNVTSDDEKIEAELRPKTPAPDRESLPNLDLYLEETLALRPHGEMPWLDGVRRPDPILLIEDMIDDWRLLRAGSLEALSARLQKFGHSLRGCGLHQALSDLFTSYAKESMDPRLKVTQLLQAARSQVMMGHFNAALDTMDAALKSVQAGGDRQREATILNDISQIHSARGDYDRSLAYLQRSLAICREIGDRAGEGTTLATLGRIHSARGDHARASEDLQQSLAIRQETGDRAGEGTTLNAIGQIHRARGDRDAALDCFRRGLTISHGAGDRRGEGAALNDIARVFAERGDHTEALTSLRQCLDIAREIGNRACMISACHNLATIARNMKEMDRYLHWEKLAYAIAEDIGDAAGLFHVGQTLGPLLVLSGHGEEGREMLRRCLAIYETSGLTGGDRIPQLIKRLEGR